MLSGEIFSVSLANLILLLYTRPVCDITRIQRRIFIKHIMIRNPRHSHNNICLFNCVQHKQSIFLGNQPCIKAQIILLHKIRSEQIQARISDALEAELSKIYDELRIESGDIAPCDLVEWDQLTNEMATLFQALIAWNSGEEEA